MEDQEIYMLRDEKGRNVAGNPDLMVVFSFLKHHVPDGEYSIEGPATDATFYRIGGIVYPSGGTVAGEKFKPRSRQECIDLANEP